MKPRILFISNNCFSSYTNNGKTFESIFSDYTKGEIAQIFFTENGNPDFAFCENYFLVNDRDVARNIFLFNKTAGKKLTEKYFCPRYTSGSSIENINFLSHSFLRFLRDILWSFKSWKSANLKNFVTDFDPDYIFFVGGASKLSHDIAMFLMKYLNKPLVVFFTDDYLLYPKVNNIWDKIQKRRMLSFYRTTINNASVCFTIGEKMSRVYSLFFRRKFETIMNSVPLLSCTQSSLSREKIMISYFGGLHTNRWKMIERLGQIVSSEFANTIALNVYTPEGVNNEVISRFKNVGINFKGPVFGEDLHRCMCDSDVLLHVESDDENSVSKTRLSVSTKIPEYLMTGRPILAYGPQNVASMELLAHNNIGLFIDSTSKDEDIKDGFRAILDYKLREKIGAAGHRFAVNNFDNRKNILHVRSFLK